MTSKKMVLNEKPIIKDYNSDMKIKDVALKHGISVTKVYEIIKRTQKLKKGFGVNTKKDKKVVNSYLKGDKVDDIAEKYNITPVTLYRILDRNNVERRKSR